MIVSTGDLNLVVLLAAAPFAWRNWRLGRGDRRGALRLALFLFGIHFVLWLLITEHVPDRGMESSMLWSGLGISLNFALPYWVGYLALEPYVRRRWPRRLVSWTRVLAGRFRDPLVGRDILLGGLLGVALTLAHVLPPALDAWRGLPSRPLQISASALTNIPFNALATVSIALPMALNFLALWFILSLLLRRAWLAAAALLAVLVGTMFFLYGGSFGISRDALLTAALELFVLLRFGLLPLVVGFTILRLLSDRPITYDFGAWYGIGSLVYLLLLASLLAYGFVVSLGSRPLFSAAFFHEE
jgi:serine/threonine-protein kinase